MLKKGKPQLNSGDPRQQKLEMFYTLRTMCRSIMIFGFMASAGGNILNAQKSVVGIAVALAAPTFLAAAFEIMSRIPLRKETSWSVKAGRIGGSAIIALISAYNSFFHQRDALLALDPGDIAQAWTLPIAVDALMIVGSVSLIELSIQIRELEAWIEGGKLTVNKPPTQKPARPVSKKEIVTKAWRDNPSLSTKDLATRLGVSYNYAHSVVTELKKQTLPSEPETVTA